MWLCEAKCDSVNIFASVYVIVQRRMYVCKSICESSCMFCDAGYWSPLQNLHQVWDMCKTTPHRFIFSLEFSSAFEVITLAMWKCRTSLQVGESCHLIYSWKNEHGRLIEDLWKFSPYSYFIVRTISCSPDIVYNMRIDEIILCFTPKHVRASCEGLGDVTSFLSLLHLINPQLSKPIYNN